LAEEGAKKTPRRIKSRAFEFPDTAPPEGANTRRRFKFPDTAPPANPEGAVAFLETLTGEKLSKEDRNSFDSFFPAGQRHHGNTKSIKSLIDWTKKQMESAQTVFTEFFTPKGKTPRKYSKVPGKDSSSSSDDKEGAPVPTPGTVSFRLKEAAAEVKKPTKRHLPR